MSTGKPTPVRLSQELLDRLELATERMGMQHRSDVIKLCVTSFLDHFEKYGKAMLPLDWKDILKDLDGRSHRYSSRKMRMKRDQVETLDDESKKPRLSKVAEPGSRYGAKKSRGKR